MTMALPCDTNNRLAGPVGTTPIQCVPPPGTTPTREVTQPNPWDDGTPMPPGYLVVARAQAQAAGTLTALARLAQAELNAGDHDAALSTATTVLDRANGSEDPAAELAAVQVLRAGGDAKRANEHIKSARAGDEVGRSIRAHLAIECGEKQRARELVEDTTTFEGLFIGGWLAMHDGDHAKAIALMRRAGRLAGPTPDVLVNTGYSYAALGHIKRAINVTSQAQALAPHRRLIAFNLVNFYLANGEYEKAAQALTPLSAHYPQDVEIALARAHIALRARTPKKALDILQNARTSTSWIGAPLIARAELEGNLALLRWLAGKWSAAEARKTIRQQLELVDYQSLPLASLLPGMLLSFNDHKELETLLAKLAEHHDTEELLGIRVHDAILKKDEQAAVTLSVRWTERQPFNPVAAALAIQLLGDLAGERERGIKLGLDALQRAPADALLANNLAYSLALAGRTREARSVLARIKTQSVAPAVVATRGLIEMLSGNVAAGVAGYRQAREQALTERKERTAMLAELNLMVALQRIDASQLDRVQEQTRGRVLLPDTAENDPAVWMLARRAEHEGISVIWNRPRDAAGRQRGHRS